MPLKFVEFSESNISISIDRGSLVVNYDGKIKKIPFDIISGVLFTGYGQKISTNVFSKLLDNRISIVFCDEKFNPKSVNIPLNGHTELMNRFNLQINTSLILSKNIWKKIVFLKINNQAECLNTLGKDGVEVRNFTRMIKSGDKDNAEAKAARIYWKIIFSEPHVRSNNSLKLNILLNYSYTVLRATVSRQLIMSGLWPMFSIKHSNKNNPFALVDDLIEPFRPIVDLYIALYEKLSVYNLELSKSFKYLFFDFLNIEVPLKDGRTSLQSLIEQFIYSYLTCLQEGNDRRLFTFELDWDAYAKRIQSHVVASNI